MNQKTLRLTYGAMLIAIFGVILVINRQAGGLLDGMILYILPIPMVAYAVRYGGKASLAVFFCMLFVSILFGSLTATFYGVSAALIGLVYGTCLYHKVDLTRTLLIVVTMTIAVELVNMVVIASLSGISIDQDIHEMQAMYNQIIEQTGMQAPVGLLEEGSLRRLILIGIAFSGAVEGALIFGLTVVVLRKLRIQMPRLTPITDIYPPKWTGFLAGVVWLWYSAALTQQNQIAQGLVSADSQTLLARCVQNDLALAITQTVGMIGYLYLFVFGIVAVSMIITKYITRKKAIVVTLVFLSMFTITIAVLFLGLFYISGTLHDRLLDRRMTI